MFTAGWPKQLHGTTTFSSKPCEVSWTFKAVEWVLANSCTWGDWQCQQLQEERYEEGYHRVMATRLFKWAHENGCSCTCEVTAVAAVVNTAQ
jgi:hypothetical protein